MSRKQKSADDEKTLRKILLITALINLLNSIITLIVLIVKLI
jgi:hypothetical protein